MNTLTSPIKPSVAMAILAVALVASGMGHSFLLISMPGLSRAMGFSDFQGGLIVSCSSLLFTLSALFWGRLCETIGRRKVILLGCFAIAVFTSLTAVVIEFRLLALLSIQGGFYCLLFIRALSAAFTGGIKPGAQAFIVDFTSLEMRARGMGLLGACYGIGAILGGLVAMSTGVEFQLTGFLGVSVVIGLACIVSYVFLPESKPASELIEVIKPLNLRPFIPYLLITLLSLVIFSILQQVMTLRLQDSFLLDLDSAMRFSGGVMMMTMVVMIIFQGVVLRMLVWPAQQLLILGAMISLCAMIAASLASSPWHLFLAMMMFGAGTGLLLPANLTLLSLQANNNQQAHIAGVNGIFQGIGLSIGPLVGAYLHQISFMAPFVLAAFMAVIILLIAFLCSVYSKVAMQMDF
jgi:DHA1 family tetracycline resistance protein-like MFS transporter